VLEKKEKAIKNVGENKEKQRDRLENGV